MAKYRLCDIAPVIQGDVPKADQYWLLNLDMVESNTGRIIEYLYCAEKDIGNSTVKFDTRNVLYCKLRPYLNKVVLPQKPGYATSEMLPLCPDQSVITREYLTYYLRSPSFVSFINEKTSGAKMPRANSADLKSYLLECPSIYEQQIATQQLDSLVSIINKRALEIQKLDDLIKARFVEMFGSNSSKVPLSDYCDVSGGYSFKSGDITTDGAIRILQIGNVSLNDVNWDTTNYLPQGYDDKYSRFLLNEGDIVVALTRPIIQSLGNVKACIVKAIDTPCLLNQRVGRITSKKDMNTDLKYIFGCLMTEDFTRYVESCCIGCSQPNISTKDIENFMIPAATSNEQKEFARFSEQVDKSKSVVQKSLDEAQLLFDSLMQKYFG